MVTAIDGNGNNRLRIYFDWRTLIPVAALGLNSGFGPYSAPPWRVDVLDLLCIQI
jgi:hypothetical protein